MDNTYGLLHESGRYDKSLFVDFKTLTLVVLYNDPMRQPLNDNSFSKVLFGGNYTRLRFLN